MKKLYNCPLCGNSLFKLYAGIKDFESKSNKKYLLYQCKICKLFQQNPVPDSKEIETFYPKNYPGNYIYDFSKTSNSLFNLIKKLLFKIYDLVFFNFYKETNQILKHKNKYGLENLKILDVGCGSGKFLISLQKYNFELLGLDIDKDCIKNLQVEYKINGAACFFLDFKSDKKYDVIFMSHFLEHSPNPRETIDFAKNLLTKKGILIIKVPNVNSFTFKVFGKYTYFLDIPRHLFDYSPYTLRNLLEISGFTRIKIKTRIDNMFIQSIFNYFNLGYVRSHFVNNFFIRFCYAFFSVFMSFIFTILLLPFYLFFEGEEIYLEAQVK